MHRFNKLALTGMLACLSIGAFAQGDIKATVKAIQSLPQQRFDEAQKNKQKFDFAIVQQEMRAMAEKALDGVDPDKIEAKDAHDYAQLYSIVEKHKIVCSLSHRFLTTNPGPDEKYASQTLMMQSCSALGEADMIVETLRDTRPPSSEMNGALANMTVYGLLDTIEKGKGVKGALNALDIVERNLVVESDADAAKRLLANEKKRREANPNANLPAPKPDEERLLELEKMARNQSDSIRALIVTKRAELIDADGRRNEAITMLDDFAAKLDEKSPIRRSVTGSRTRISITNGIAPALGKERGYGEFSTLEALKGKVVIVDFFAHWCGPCKAAFPELSSLYADLKDKGLEILGVTTYYGYYGQERNLGKDDEFARMDGFMKEHKMTWPVIYGERSNFDAYGVTGIPQVAILDKKGVVRKIKIGYDKNDAEAFRAFLEKLLAE